MTDQSETTCPRCAETVKAEALTCKHCGTDFDMVTTAGRRRTAPWVPVVICLLILAGGLYLITKAVDDSKAKARENIEQLECETLGHC